MQRQVHDEIPHWLCVECGAIQPLPRECAYPELPCWRCKCTDFIRDHIPPLYVDDHKS